MRCFEDVIRKGEIMGLDVMLTTAVLCIALVLIWASLKDE